MRRAALLAVLVGGVVAAVLFSLRGNEPSSYRVDVVFDTAKGIVPGQLVKIAGARVGRVSEVNLTPERKARITLSVEEGLTPFRADASCRILPEGFISENFVECDPGSAGDPLAPGPSGAPTVRLQQTTVPISLQDVIDIFSLPVDQRIRALINELGLATAGRGAEINAILRRANPTLTETRRVLSILADQRRELSKAIGQTDTVLDRLSRNRDSLRVFIDRSSAVSDETATHATALGEAVRELPPLLDATENGLGSLRRVTSRGTPLLRDLRASAPELVDLTRSLSAFARPGRPALRRVGAASAVGKPALAALRPAISSLETLASDARPVTRQIATLSASLAETGGTEALLRLVYQLATMSAAYDSTSHLAGIYIGLYPQCLLDLNQPACRHSYSAPGNGTIPVNAPSAGPQDPGTVLPSSTPVDGASESKRALKRDPEGVDQLLEFLLK